MSNQPATYVHPDPPAQQLRSMLAGSPSLTLRACGHRADVVGRHSVDTDGTIRLDLPADSRLAAEAVRRREMAAMIEVTDLAPTPVRDRIRARATLTGWLSPADTHDNGHDLAVVLVVACAELSTAEGSTAVDPDEFAVAEPDPLATEEAELLCHLDGHHLRTVEQLCRLVDPRYLQGVRRVTPVRLDRHGLVLRLDHADWHLDARLAFTPALHHPDEVGARLKALLDATSACRRRRRP